MINLNEPRRPKKEKVGSDLWFYGACFIAIGLVFFFGFDESRDGVRWFYLGLFMLVIYSAAKKRGKTLRLVLVFLGYLATIFITEASKVRQLAPFLNTVQPHLEMQAVQVKAINQRGSVRAQPGYIFRVFTLSLRSKLFAKVDDVYVSRFSLELGDDTYEDYEPFWEARNDRTLAQSCHIQDLELAPNVTVTCQLVFEIPIKTQSGTLIYDDDYKAWANVSF